MVADMLVNNREQTHDFLNRTHKPLQLIQKADSQTEPSVLSNSFSLDGLQRRTHDTFIYGSTNSTGETLKCEICILIICISLPYLTFFPSIKHAPTLSHTCATMCMQINTLASWSAALAAKKFAKCPQRRGLFYTVISYYTWIHW